MHPVAQTLLLLAALSSAGERITEARYEGGGLLGDLSPDGETLTDYDFRLVNTVISEQERGIRDFDVVDSARFCQAQSGWICVIGSNYAFAVPIRRRVERWERGGVHFRYMGERTIHLLGQELRIDVIVSERHLPKEVTPSRTFPEMTVRWVNYYSETHGLIAFGRVSPTSYEPAMRYAITKCGYGGLKRHCK